MIAPMKKVWLVLLASERDRGLGKLSELGLVHLETKLPSGSGYESLLRKKDEILRAINSLPRPKRPGPATLDSEAAYARARRVNELEERKAKLQEEASALDNEIARCREWGEFEPEDVAALARDGVPMRFYKLDAKSAARLPEDIEYVRLGSARGQVYLAALGEAGLPGDYVPFKLPEHSLEASYKRRDTIRGEIAEVERERLSHSADIPSFERAIAAVDQELRFETARSSMDADGPVCFIKGFVPAKEEAAIRDAAKSHGWALVIDDPSDEDRPPTKVENGPLVRMIAPVFEFLGTVPGYREYEISPWFLVFFCIFYAMIFGDAGYGAIMLLGGIVAGAKGKAKAGKVPDSARLLITLSAFTIAWGTLTASWFSTPVELLPRFLIDASVPAISNGIVVDGRVVANDTKVIMKNVQTLCFLIGVIQLTIAHLKNFFRDFPNPKVLAQVGALGMIYGMLFFVMFLVVDAKAYPPPPYALWLVLGGFALNFVFGSWNGKLLGSFLEGLKNIIPNFLGMVGIFADIVSYIRLWAVGIAGAQLASIVNGMGGGMVKPAFTLVFGVIILAFGHVLNMVLSVLSVVVHGVRLNMLEFSSHLGMEWSGIKYDPFRVTHQE